MKKKFIVRIATLLLLITIISCSNSKQIIENTTTKPIMKTYLALGDSYTIGEAVHENERFPAQTINKLIAEGINIHQPEYIATTGWATINLQNAIATKNLQTTYDVVSLLIGVNDQYQHLDTAGYRIRFTQLLQTAIELAGNKPTHVFVLSIPDYSVTAFGQKMNAEQISKEIDEFNSINKQITSTFTGVNYLDITPSTKLALHDLSLVAEDGLHPSAKEYTVWADKLAPLMLNVLK